MEAATNPTKRFMSSVAMGRHTVSGDGLTSLSVQHSTKEPGELFIEVDCEEIKMVEVRKLSSVHLESY